MLAVGDLGSTGLQAARQYKAVVVDDNDPKMLQRVRARFEFFAMYADDELPWAIPNMNHADGATAKTGSVSIPKKGSFVWLQFQEGKETHPMYSGYHVDETTVIEESKTNYPHRTVHRFANNALMVIDTLDNEVYLRNPGNVKLYIDGNVELHVKGNVEERVEGNITRHCEGNVDETVIGNYTRRIAGDFNETVEGDAATTYQSNFDQTTTGNKTVSVTGNLDETVTGNVARKVTGTTDVMQMGPVKIASMGTVDLHTAGVETKTVVGTYQITGLDVTILALQVFGFGGGGSLGKFSADGAAIQTSGPLAMKGGQLKFNPSTSVPSIPTPPAAALPSAPIAATQASAAKSNNFTEWKGIPGGEVGE